MAATPVSPVPNNTAVTQNISVFCRFRPEDDLEREKGGEQCAFFEEDDVTVTLKVLDKNKNTSNQNKELRYQFSYDRVFAPYATQEEIYLNTSAPIIQSFLNGVNGAVIAYGQTGAGKTFTMFGPGFDDPRNIEGPQTHLRGIIPRLMEDLFANLPEGSLINASYVEIYNENLRDLLADSERRKRSSSTTSLGSLSSTSSSSSSSSSMSISSPTQSLPLKMQKLPDGSLRIVGAVQRRINDMFDVRKVMKDGAKARIVGATEQNIESSRSHAVLILTLSRGGMVSQLSLVDLAGSEKFKKTNAQGLRREEAKSINKSLLTLGKVIQALSNDSKKKKGDVTPVYIPYRDSKLTRLLENSLGGNSKTILIINCSPSSYNAEETLSTLRFGDKSKLIKTKFESNVVSNQKDNKELMRLLDAARSELDSYKQKVALLEQQIRQLGAEPIVCSPSIPLPALSSPSSSSSMDIDLLSEPPSPSRAVLPKPSSSSSPPSSLTPLKPSSTSPTRAMFPSALLSLQSSDVFQFICPLSRTVFKDPVIAMDGQTYERSAIIKWFKKYPSKSPLSNKRMPSSILVPNLLLRQQLNVIYPRIKSFYECIVTVLPDELLLKIFSYLTERNDLIRVSYVCKGWWRIAQDDTLWESCKLPPTPSLWYRRGNTLPKEKRGKELYIEKYRNTIPLYRVPQKVSELTLVPAKKAV
eukprot:TRINITY_DN279_c0_g1_i1.p1 TRINITY_DN279_c0_g1~~TRINITY_DN279_c0_g1_i1.p1  ORF type:complete len:697 (-),score=174.81 TRINITY_DN279_c0_g1_i1:103-2193(-)